MSSIFISYNRKNQSIADALASDLHALDHAIWLDEQLGGGKPWWEEILNRVRSCDVFVFVLDPESLDSDACTSELGYAHALGKPILPIRVSDQVSASDLPEALSLIQYVDYSETDRNAAFRLARALAGIGAPPPLPEPLPKPPPVPVSYLGRLEVQLNSKSELARAEQADLLFQLKQKLNDPEHGHEARALLVRLRDRDDTRGPVVREINNLLGDAAPGFDPVRTTPLDRDFSGHATTGSSGTGGFGAHQTGPTTNISSGNLGGRQAPPPRNPGPSPQYPIPKIPNYLVWSILTVFCCLPVAIVSIIFAAQVNKKVAAGDYAGAMNASKYAKTFAIIATVAGIIAWALYIFSVLLTASQQR